MPGVKAPESERREQILQAAVAVATSERLDGMTVRKVAERAGLSPGLVFFHFTSKDQLLLALLDRVLTEIIGRLPPEDAAGASSARDALLDHARRELARVPHERDVLELFFQFWVLGTGHPEVRTRMVDALAAYQASFVPLARRIIEEEADRYRGVTPDDIARVVMGFVQGTAFQGVLAPEEHDVAATMGALESLVPPRRTG